MFKGIIVIFALLGLFSVLTKERSSSSTAAGAAQPAPDPHAGARAACKTFIERQQLETANAVWGNWTEWTLVQNDDGSISVGARYAVGSRTRYTNCMMRRDGPDWRLIRLSRLQ